MPFIGLGSKIQFVIIIIIIIYWRKCESFIWDKRDRLAQMAFPAIETLIAPDTTT